MHGYWIALGRVMADRWLLPEWVPYWAGGMPAELTYAPLTPWLGWHFGIYAVMAGIFAIGPAALFLMTWRLSGKPGWAFVTGVFYSLTSPTELIMPDAAFGWVHVLDSRRLYLTLVWDEAPHQLALAMVCLAVAAWSSGWRRAAVVAIVLAALANPFGITGAALMALCWVLVTGNWRMAALTGVWGYLIVCPFYPPSLLAILKTNGATAPESALTRGSWAGWAAVGAGVALIWFLTRPWEPVRRFALLLAFIATSLSFLYYRWNIVLAQQPGRYKSEMELALVLAIVFGLERVLSGRPRWLLVPLAIAGLLAASLLVVRQRRFSRRLIQQAVAEESIEYKAAKAARGTVFAAGSLAQWMNVYAGVQQYTGGAYTTAPNPVQQRLVAESMGERSWENFVLRMQAVGVDAVIVPGRSSPEFWKPFATDVLAGHLPVIWQERDTRMYQVPRAKPTMAHSVPGLLPLKEYVQAIEDPKAPALHVEWPAANRAIVRGAWRPGDMVLVHMNWHKGWTARLNGAAVPTGADGFGQMVIVPGGAGELELHFDGAWEAWVTRGISVLALLALGFRLSRRA